LEAVTKYMKENLEMNYCEIADILNRNERTIWTAYNKAKQKQPELINLEKTLMMLPIIKLEKILIVLPVSLFQNRKLTILECIITYLKEKGLKFSEIAGLLNRDQRNIWAIYTKAMKKMQ
jgi:DNA-directed RNA polymerase specialized sigma24 family protein